MQENIKIGLEILKTWPSDESGGLYEAISKYYAGLIRDRNVSVKNRASAVRPYGAYIKNSDALLQKLISEIGINGLSALLIFIFNNDNRFSNTDTLDNYKDYKPHPSYLVIFANTLIVLMPAGTRSKELFDAFWEYQSRLPLGLDEQFVKLYLDPFIEQGITTKEEIKRLLIRDWWRAQESTDDSLYCGPCIGAVYYYFRNSWVGIKKDLEEEYRKKTGKEPKKIY